MHYLHKALLLVPLLITVPSFAPIEAQTAATPSPSASSPNLGQLQQMIPNRRTCCRSSKQLDELATQRPVPAGVNRLRGLALYSQSHFAEADAAFSSAIQQDSHDEESMQIRGLPSSVSAGPRTRFHCSRRHITGPRRPRSTPNYVLALSYLDTRRYDDARHAFAKQYGFAPDSASAYLLAARMLLRRKYVSVAQQFAKKALELIHNFRSHTPSSVRLHLQASISTTLSPSLKKSALAIHSKEVFMTDWVMPILVRGTIRRRSKRCSRPCCWNRTRLDLISC